MDYDISVHENSIEPGVSSNWHDNHYDNYICFEQYSVKRSITKDGKVLFADKRKGTMYETITDLQELSLLRTFL